jgi:FixJ family two-component response regulator
VSEVATVRVVDDDPSCLVGISRMLRAAGFEVRTFGSGAELLAQVDAASRGCVVADLRMPGLDGIALQEALGRSGAQLPVVFLTGLGDIPSTVRAMRQGAVDFLEKSAPDGLLIDAVTRALERGTAECAARARRDELQRLFAGLTERELQVLRHVVRGRMNKQIAAELGIHERTVKLHRTAITRKLGVASTASLTALAGEAGLLPAQSHGSPATR